MFDLALWYRTAGGFLGLGSTFLCRLRWSLIMAAYMAFAAVVHWQPVLQVLIIFAGVTVGAFLGRLIPHARFQATASLWNSLGMAAVNLVRFALIVGPYAYFEPIRLTLVAYGAIAGVAYYIGNKYLSGKDSGIYFRNNHGQWLIKSAPLILTTITPPLTDADYLDQAAVGGSEWGELLTGFGYELMFLTALVLS